MRKTVIFSLCLILTTIAASAQSFTIGPKAGLNYSTIIAKDKQVTNNYMLGYQAGVFARLGLLGLYVQPEAYIGMKGANVKMSQNGDVESKVRFTTIDVPVLFGVKLFQVAKINARVLMGPMVSFNVHTDDDGMASTSPEAYKYEDKIWGGQIGVGADIGKLTFDARYERGFSDFNKSLGQKTSLFNFSLGWKLL